MPGWGRTAEILPGQVEVAQRLEGLGYRRVWYAEHHASPAMADFPPAVVIAHVAAATSTIRVGSGGVLVPNHVPLALAEQFGALAAVHPGRIDIGIGRGPGTFSQEAARALRRGAEPTTDEEYGADVAALLDLVGRRAEPWLLSSSQAGADLAAAGDGECHGGLRGDHGGGAAVGVAGGGGAGFRGFTRA